MKARVRRKERKQGKAVNTWRSLREKGKDKEGRVKKGKIKKTEKKMKNRKRRNKKEKERKMMIQQLVNKKGK